MPDQITYTGTTGYRTSIAMGARGVARRIPGAQAVLKHARAILHGARCIFFHWGCHQIIKSEGWSVLHLRCRKCGRRTTHTWFPVR